MKEDMKKFIEAVSADPELKKKADAICLSPDDTPEQKTAAMIDLAAGLGFSLTAEDLSDGTGTKELNDEEAEAVTGGGGCGCLGPGGGGGDGLKCGCFTGGHGRVFEYNSADDLYYQQSYGEGACFCAGPGAGATHRHCKCFKQGNG